MFSNRFLTSLFRLICATVFIVATQKADTFIYSHGFGNSGIKAKRYVRADVLPKDVVSFDYQDARIKIEFPWGRGIGINRWDSCIGQEQDVAKLAQVVQEQKDSVILFGESRGASTILNYLGSDLCEQDKIKAVVLDCPFDSMISVIRHLFKQLYIEHFLSHDYTGAFFKRFYPDNIHLLDVNKAALMVHAQFPFFMPNYKADAIEPIDSVTRINKEIPILFICTSEDKLVPHTCTERLVAKLKEQGHEKVYMHVLKGKHAWIVDGPDKQKYHDVIHEFYKNHGVEYKG